VIGEDPTHRGDAPTPVDLAGHFKELGRALLPALVIALLVGGAVFGLRAVLTPKEYGASIVTEIKPAQTPIPGDAFIEQMRAPFMGLAQDTNVLNQVLSEVNTGWSAATLREHVQLAPGPSPMLLIFTVTAPSSDMARQLVKAMVVTVAQAAFANNERDAGTKLEQVQASIAAEEAANATRAPDDPARAQSDARLSDLRSQLSGLQTGGDALTVLATPETSAAPVSPQPLSEALVAGLAALVVAAELIVVWRGRIGSKPNRTWARRMAHRYQAGFEVAPVTQGELPTLLSAELSGLQREGRAVLVLQGADAVFPRSAVLPTNGEGAQGRMLSAPLDNPWWRHVDATDVALGVVLVSTQSSDRKHAEAALRELTALGVPRRWLVLQRPRHGRRRSGATRTESSAASHPATISDPVASNGFDPHPKPAESHAE
jgi:capsular polysaccharide biosynthesis protein